MKRILLISIAILLSANLFSQNLNFENWTQDDILYLDNYTSMIDMNAAYGSLSVTRSTDFTDGSYSIRLETILSADNDTIFGFFMNGDPDDYSGGHPVTLNTVDSVVGYYKYMVQPGDTALFLCATKYIGIPSGGDLFKITGSQPNWTRFSYPVNATFVDSVIIAGASSNAMEQVGMTPGSVIMFDDIQLKSNVFGMEPIQNHSFENWTNETWEDLDEWTTANQYLVGAATLPVEKTTDAYDGTYASVLTSVLHFEGDTIDGFMSYGQWGEGGPIGGFPYAEMPDVVRFHYKTNLVGIDTASVSIIFKKDGNPIAWHGAQLVDNELSYTLFTQPVSLPEAPDTVFVAFSSGENPGSQMVVDNLEFLITVGMSNKHKIEQVVAFPNPVKDKLNFRIQANDNVEIAIYSLDGKLEKVERFGANSHDVSIDISGIAQGNYIYKVKVGKETYSKTFVKQ